MNAACTCAEEESAECVDAKVGPARDLAHFRARAIEDGDYSIPITGVGLTIGSCTLMNVEEKIDECDCGTVENAHLLSFEETDASTTLFVLDGEIL